MASNGSTLPKPGGQEAASTATSDHDVGAGENDELATARRKAAPIESFRDLVLEVYDGRGAKKVRKLKAKELDALLKHRTTPVEDHQDLIHLAASRDDLLDRTRQLMVFGLRQAVPVVASQITEFGRHVLARHSLFRSDALQATLWNRPGGLGDQQAVSTVLLADWVPGGTNPLQKVDRDRCRTNGAQCLLMFLWGVRPMSLARAHRLLQEAVWGVGRPPLTTEDSLVALLANKDPLAASVAYGLMADEVKQATLGRETAIQREARALDRLASTQVRLTALEQELKGAVAATQAERAARAEEGRSHKIQSTRQRDDYERLRGRLLRKLNDTSVLLDEGLHALTRDPPKVRVMVDRAELAIDGLKSEIERLRR